MSFIEFIKGIDFFGREPEFYIQGRPKQVSILGRIFTYIFMIIYITIFIYKVYRMTERVDITFYDSYSNTDEIPTIKITQDNFTLMFAVYDENEQPFIDETIYYPEAHFSDEEIEDIKIERCNPDKISQKFIEYFGESEIGNYYCLTDIDYSLQPFMNSLRVEIYACRNIDEDDDFCEDREFIEEYLNTRPFMVFFQDIMLTPLNFKFPVKEKISNLNTEIFKNLGQYLHTEMQIVRIETSTNIIGFDFLTEPKIEEFIKFDNEVILPYPGYNLDDEDNYYPLSIFELQINDKILLEKRQYLQLIDVLGEIGGFMEMMYSFFGLICSLITDILYEKTVTNNLFSFDLKKKYISIKIREQRKFKISKDKIIGDQNPSEINLISKTKKKRKKNIFIIPQKNINDINNKNNPNDLSTKKDMVELNSAKKEIKIENIDFQSNKQGYKDINKNNAESSYNLTKELKSNKDNGDDRIIKEITLKEMFISICSCCGKKRRNIYNILIEESMNIIMEKLDIFNIFRDLCLIEYSNDELNNNRVIINMSEECSKDVLEHLK